MRKDLVIYMALEPTLRHTLHVKPVVFHVDSQYIKKYGGLTLMASFFTKNAGIVWKLY